VTESSKSSRPGKTAVPPRGAKGRPGSRPAANGRGPTGRQARQAAQRRNRTYGIVAVIAVVAIVVVLIVVKVAGGGSGNSSLRHPMAAADSTKLQNVPVAVLTAAATKVTQLYPAQPAKGGTLTSGGKPEVLFIGAEFCPVCATERWPMTVALSQFGKFTNLQQTHSAVTDGNIPTLSFYGATYSSPYINFVSVENETNTEKLLQTPTAAQTTLWEQNTSSSQPTYPFLDIAGKDAVTTAQFPETVLEGPSFSDILNSVGDNTNTIGADVDASAAVLTKLICGATNQTPAATCKAVANVPAPLQNASGGSSTPAG
jgi:hypothetical protein